VAGDRVLGDPLSRWPHRGSLADMDFELIGELSEVETIAVNLSIRENADLKARHGGRRWRKLKGVGAVRLSNGNIRRAELHWYEAHGVGKRKMKIKRLLD
jgi:hypothetical protein